MAPGKFTGAVKGNQADEKLNRDKSPGRADPAARLSIEAAGLSWKHLSILIHRYRRRKQAETLQRQALIAGFRSNSARLLG